MFFRKKEKDSEIKTLENELNSLYDEYIEYYRGSKDAFVAYHDRYVQAIKKDIDLVEFLKAERNFVRQLIEQFQKSEEREEEKISLMSVIALKRQESISAYPEISYFPEMDYELRKFFGVMKQLTEVDFPEIEKILRYKHGRALDSQLDKIQSELAVFVPRVTATVPAALVRYKIFLTGSASDLETEKEKNQILQKGASLLKGIYQFLHQEMRKNQTLELSERKIIINKENYIEQILNDFRIRDISAATVF